MNVNIKRVAAHAGVSTATVSHVINGTRYVSPETEKKVNDALRDLKYTPSAIAKSLRIQKTHTIGLMMPIMVPNFSDEYNMRIAYGIRNGLRLRSYNLILGSTDNTMEGERDQIKMFVTQRVDGLIMMPSRSDEEYLTELRDLKIPVVFIDRMAKGEYGDCVLCDNYSGAHNAVTALIGKGHKKIGFMTNNEKVTTSFDRLRGYRAALSEAGLDMDEGLIRIGDCAFDSGRRFMRELYEECGVTAVFAADNLMAMGALSYVNNEGIDMPKDLAFITFDEHDWENAMKPSISAVKQPSYELGLKAAQMMLERIENPQKPFETCILSTQLLLRESV